MNVAFYSIIFVVWFVLLVLAVIAGWQPSQDVVSFLTGGGLAGYMQGVGTIVAAADAAAKPDGSSKQTAPANTTKGSSDSSSGASTGAAGTDPSAAPDKTAPVNGEPAQPNSKTDESK